MTEHHIRYDIDADGIGVITIDRPEKRNAMTYAMLGKFIGCVGEAGADDKVRVLVITGSGGAFCAGTDLADLATIPGETRGVRGRADAADELAEHGVGHRIAFLRPINGDHPDAVSVDVIANVMFGHGSCSCPSGAGATPSRRLCFAWSLAASGGVPHACFAA